MGRWTSRSAGFFVLFLFVLQTAVFSEERYTVKSGDSLYKISKTYGVSVGALKALNHLEKETLRLNQTILIPTSKEKQAGEIAKKSSNKPPSTPSRARLSADVRANPYVVKKGDNLSIISKKVGLSVDEIKQINQLRTNNLKAGQILLLSVSANVVEEPDEEIGDPEEAPEDSTEDE